MIEGKPEGVSDARWERHLQKAADSVADMKRIGRQYEADQRATNASLQADADGRWK